MAEGGASERVNFVPSCPQVPTSTGAATNARRRLSERGVGERVQRLVQLAELAGDEHEPFLPLRHAVQPLELVGDPIEALEERVQLTIGDVLCVHTLDSTRRPLRAARHGY